MTSLAIAVLFALCDRLLYCSFSFVLPSYSNQLFFMFFGVNVVCCCCDFVVVILNSFLPPPQFIFFTYKFSNSCTSFTSFLLHFFFSSPHIQLFYRNNGYSSNRNINFKCKALQRYVDAPLPFGLLASYFSLGHLFWFRKGLFFVLFLMPI